MPDLFKEIVPSILQTKKEVISDDESAKDYAPFLVNKAVSQHVDCVMYANVMNMNYHLHKKAQYDYLINSVRAMKRSHAKWYKSTKVCDLEAIKLFFGYSTRRAREAIKLLSAEQIDTIKRKTNIGD
jgi:hypothetical protein